MVPFHASQRFHSRRDSWGRIQGATEALLEGLSSCEISYLNVCIKSKIIQVKLASIFRIMDFKTLFFI